MTSNHFLSPEIDHPVKLSTSEFYLLTSLFEPLEAYKNQSRPDFQTTMEGDSQILDWGMRIAWRIGGSMIFQKLEILDWSFAKTV